MEADKEALELWLWLCGTTVADETKLPSRGVERGG